MKKILFLSEVYRKDQRIDPPDFLKSLGDECDVTAVGVPYGRFFRQMLGVVLGRTGIGRHDLVVTTAYQLTFAVCLRQVLFGGRARHVAVSMNLSRRPVTSRLPWLKRLIDRVFATLDLAIVHSVHEAALFAELHGLPRDKFAFAHWGYDAPEVTSTMFDDHPKPYFCMIGRNNRDHATFFAAMAGLDARGVLVVPGYARPDGPDVPGNVDVFTDLDPVECLSCQKNALANLILVQDGARGAGHITAVSAMHLGVPQIATEVPPLGDYLIDGVTAMTVPLGDAAALRGRLEALLADPAAADPLVRRGRRMAARWLTADASAARLADLIRAVMEGRQPGFTDPDWPAWRAELEAEAEAEADASPHPGR